MSTYGNKIAELRKKAGMTQAQLGKRLNITSQAVSKWENDLSEPDLETIHTICTLFSVDVNDFLENGEQTPESKEAVATENTAFGFCELCGSPVSQGEYKIMTTEKRVRHGKHHHTETTSHIYCNSCYEIIQKQLQEETMEEEKREMEAKTYEAHVRFVRGLKWGTIAAAVCFIVLLIFAFSQTFASTLGYIFLSIGLIYASFALISQCFWDGIVLDILEFFCHSFKLPGVIFSLDLEGIISLILIKVTLSILSFTLSIMLFLLGVVIAAAFSVFSFPFSLAINKA